MNILTNDSDEWLCVCVCIHGSSIGKMVRNDDGDTLISYIIHEKLFYVSLPLHKLEMTSDMVDDRKTLAVNYDEYNIYIFILACVNDTRLMNYNCEL